jgi:hypothetical protein
MIPAQLYDSPGTSPATDVLIATVRLRVEHRAEPVVAHFKGDGGWEHLADEARTLSVRFVCEGITSPDWVATLLGRQKGGVISGYRVAMADGEEHAGQFFVAQLDESADAEERRRFRLVLRSSGAVAHVPPS